MTDDQRRMLDDLVERDRVTDDERQRRRESWSDFEPIPEDRADG